MLSTRKSCCWASVLSAGALALAAGFFRWWRRRLPVAAPPAAVPAAPTRDAAVAQYIDALAATGQPLPPPPPPRAGPRRNFFQEMFAGGGEGVVLGIFCIAMALAFLAIILGASGYMVYQAVRPVPADPVAALTLHLWRNGVRENSGMAVQQVTTSATTMQYTSDNTVPGSEPVVWLIAGLRAGRAAAPVVFAHTSSERLVFTTTHQVQDLYGQEQTLTALTITFTRPLSDQLQPHGDLRCLGLLLERGTAGSAVLVAPTLAQTWHDFIAGCPALVDQEVAP